MMTTSLRVGRTSQGVPVAPSLDPGSQNVQIGKLKGRNFTSEEECQFCRLILHVS